jgi:maleylpyruvate isomerase
VPAEPRSDLDGCRAAHRALFETLAALDDATARGPSALPDWTVGHVITHLARNADGLRGQFEAAAQGEVAQQYPGGAGQRAGDIEAGADRPATELLDDVHAATSRLEAAWDAATDDAWRSGKARAGDREFDLAFLPFRRWREVEVHHADLLMGFTSADWTDAYVARELSVTIGETAERVTDGTLVLVANDLGDRWTGKRWTGKRWTIGATEPATTVEAPARELLAWLFGREELPGTPPILAWQREHR